MTSRFLFAFKKYFSLNFPCHSSPSTTNYVYDFDVTAKLIYLFFLDLLFVFFLVFFLLGTLCIYFLIKITHPFFISRFVYSHFTSRNVQSYTLVIKVKLHQKNYSSNSKIVKSKLTIHNETKYLWKTCVVSSLNNDLNLKTFLAIQFLSKYHWK